MRYTGKMNFIKIMTFYWWHFLTDINAFSICKHDNLKKRIKYINGIADVLHTENCMEIDG